MTPRNSPKVSDLDGSCRRLAIGLWGKYGLGRQFDRSAMNDMIQSCVCEGLDAEARGLNIDAAMWRGVHDYLRLMLYGSSTKRRVRRRTVSMDCVMPIVDGDRPVDELAEAMRAAERIEPGGRVWKYFFGGEGFSDQAEAEGVTESAIRQTVKSWLYNP